MELKFAEIFMALSLFFSVLVVSASRLFAIVKAYALQSLCIAVATFLVASIEGVPHMYISALLMLVVKAILIPYFLIIIIRRLRIKRQVEARIDIFASTIFCSVIVIFSYFICQNLGFSHESLGFNVMPLSLSIVLIGIFIMLSRRKAITQLIGALTMENGVFMAAIASTHGMPVFVELGIFLDILFAVLIAGIFTYHMSDVIEDIDVSKLTKFKE